MMGTERVSSTERRFTVSIKLAALIVITCTALLGGTGWAWHYVREQYGTQGIFDSVNDGFYLIALSLKIVVVITIWECVKYVRSGKKESTVEKTITAQQPADGEKE